ncbi:hypothetical protein [Haloechinothrix halophila]|uniref:hypothetical protein n=1 Tax=Haloechinothrix halophila TaxID=1069073 RepID=UPI00040781B1|nr:hypothetical protein [Haloechinothrix halophila]
MALPICAIGIALIGLAPVLSGGFLLHYDMVFTPRQPLLPDVIGVSSTLPRSVPADAVLALATTIVPGDVLQKLILFGAFVAAPLGAGRLVPTVSTGTRLVAAVAYGWTPFVAERLFLGHWPYLIAYACLPWVVAFGLALRRGEPRALPKLVLAIAPAVLTPSGGIIVCLAALASAGVRRAASVGGAAVVLNAPWLVPALLHGGSALSSPDAVAAFAARAENWAGPVVSVLGLGGVWNADAVPASRAVPLVPVFTLVFVVLALLGQRVLASRIGAAPARSLLALGAGGVVLASLATVPYGADLLRWLVVTVPGAGLLRDGQKWVALWAVPFALGLALAVEQAARYLRERWQRVALFTAAAVAPLILLPDLAFAGFGRLTPVHYPDDWRAVAERLADDPREGDVVALPLSSFRVFAWNGNRPMHDPAPRFLPRDTVIGDTLYVDGDPITGEDPRAEQVRRTLAADGDLGAIGIGWVLVEHGTPGDVDPALLDRLDREYRGEWLSLYRVAGDIGRAQQFAPPLVPVLLADGLAILLIGSSLLAGYCPWPRGRDRLSATSEVEGVRWPSS